MTDILYAEALVRVLRESLEKDDRVHLMWQYFLGPTPHRERMAGGRGVLPEIFGNCASSHFSRSSNNGLASS